MLLVLLTWSLLMLSLKRTAGYMSYRHVMFLAIVLLPLAGQGLVILAGWLRVVLARFAPPAGVVAVLLSAALAAHALHGPLAQGAGAYHAAAARVAELARPGDVILADTRSMEFALLNVQRDWRVIRIPSGLPLGEISALMERHAASWAAIRLPSGGAASQPGQISFDQAHLYHVGVWPVSGFAEEMHLLARGAVLAPASQPD